MDYEDVFGSAPLSTNNFKVYAKEKPIRAIEFLAIFGSSSSNNLGYNLYNTRTHVGIFDILLGYANNLNANAYYNRRGENAITLVGTKGIGKTFSLQAFVKLCPYVVPNIYAVYVNFNNILSSEPEFNYSLITIISLQLRLLGVPVPEMDESVIGAKDNLLNYLVASNTKILIVVDELDQLYKSTRTISKITINDLAALGNQPTGKVFVVICGSSMMMNEVIFHGADENVRREFPLLTSGGIPNLNCTKYLIMHVYSMLPTDLDAVSSMANRPNNEANKGWLRFVAFLGGCSARATTRLLAHGYVSDHVLEEFSPDTLLNGHSTSMDEALRLLYAQILTRSYQMNEVLLVELLDKTNGSLIFDNIGTIAWEERYVPLTYNDVQDIWKVLLENGSVPQNHRSNMSYYICHLTDRSCFVLSKCWKYIYPYSMFHLLKPYISMKMLPTVQDQLVATIKRGMEDVRVSPLADPKLSLATVGTGKCAGICIVI